MMVMRMSRGVRRMMCRRTTIRSVRSSQSAQNRNWSSVDRPMLAEWYIHRKRKRQILVRARVGFK